MIVYHVQYTYMCTCAHLQRTSSRGKARVRQKSVDFVADIVGELNCRTCRTRRLPLENPRAEVGDEVRVVVSVRVSPVEFKFDRLQQFCLLWQQTIIV